MKRIPKAFQLGGHTFTVRLVSQSEINRKAGMPVYGLFLPDTLEIWLSKPTRKLKRSVVMQTFWHEFEHARLWTMQSKLWEDEKFVDLSGHLMKQFHDTVKF